MVDIITSELKSFLNESGQLTVLPAKYKKKLIAYYYLSTKFEVGRRYSESEINDILNGWTVFRDPATLRRELFVKQLLNRTNDCRWYWKEENEPTLEEFIERFA
ncbi:MAG: DUF2087 domain-containing protein [Clostridiales bacterium]|nr:DUF2087 domain-containing protein [Clostridiales bacterium]